MIVSDCTALKFTEEMSQLEAIPFTNSSGYGGSDNCPVGKFLILEPPLSLRNLLSSAEASHIDCGGGASPLMRGDAWKRASPINCLHVG